MYDLAFFAYPALVGVVLSFAAIALGELGPLSRQRAVATVRSAERKAKDLKARKPLASSALSPCTTC